MTAYLRPAALDEALGALAAGSPEAESWTILAGATDHYPARVGRPSADDVLDITAISALRGIARTDEGWRIGALTDFPANPGHP